MYIQCGYSVYCTLLTTQSDQGHPPTCVGGGGGVFGKKSKEEDSMQDKEMLSHN